MLQKINESEKNNNKNEKKEIYGIYLNLKTRLSSTSGIFDYNSSKNNCLNTYISLKTGKKMLFFFRTQNDIIKAYKNQGDKESGNEEQLLFTISSGKQTFTFGIDLKYKFPFNEINEINIESLNYFIWYVINSESNKIKNPNEDYYLSEGDIIKFGKVKYIVKKINIKGKQTEDNNNVNNIFNLVPECLEFKKCDYCDETTFHLCKCDDYIHLSCIKEWIDERLTKKKNNKQNVTNYNFSIFKCQEILQLNKRCEEKEHRDCECIRCNTYYPLRFKYKCKYFDEKEKKEKDEKLVDIYPIEINENSNYMILESLEYCDQNINSAKTIKSIHVIDLTNEGDFNIGKGYHNDIIVNHSSVCKDHAVIKYKGGKLLLKNKNDRAGTLVLIKAHNYKVSGKGTEIYLQIDKTFIEAKIMDEKEFLETKKNNETIYPIIQDKKNTVENPIEEGKLKNNEQKPNNDEINKKNVNKSENEIEKWAENIKTDDYIIQPSYASKFYGDK